MLRPLYKPAICPTIYTPAALTTAACQPPPASPKAQIPAYSLITAEANPQTHALYSNLAELGRTSLLFGHQNSTAYGVLWYGEPGRSDIKDITGSYPAVMGWDLGDLELGVKLNLIDKSGAWYAYNGEKIGQGKKNVATYLEENPDLAQELEGKIRAQLLGGSSNELMIAAAEAGDAEEAYSDVD